jgi:hypothetical protein
MIAAIFLIALGVYLVCGTLFAFAFVTVGAGRVDAHAIGGTWGFRVLIFPGAALLWPLLLKRWLASPKSSTPHPS